MPRHGGVCGGSVNQPAHAPVFEVRGAAEVEAAGAAVEGAIERFVRASKAMRVVQRQDGNGTTAISRPMLDIAPIRAALVQELEQAWQRCS